jgi:hypothetical protein
MPGIGGFEWIILGVCCLAAGGAGVAILAFLIAKRSGR